MRGIVLGLVGSLAWAGLAPSALAQPPAKGQECRPPAASETGFQDCRIRIADARTFCRCRVVPGLARRSRLGDAVSALTPRPGAAADSLP